MKLSGRLRMIFAVAAALLLIMAASLGMRSTGPTTDAVTVAQVEQTQCTGDCATCPNAKAEGCPSVEGAAATQAEGGPTLDTAKCIGCVRCVNVSPEAFAMDPETRKAHIIDGAPQEAVERGALACPVHAITP